MVSYMEGDKEVVGHTHCVVDELIMSKQERTRRWRLPCSFPHVLPASFVCGTPMSFLFGAIRGEAEAEGSGDRKSVV